MTARSAVAGDLRRVNRGNLLRPLFLDGPLNRIQLGRITGLSSGGVTNLCAEMLEEGLIVEAGHERSQGGRPRVQLEVNPSFGTVVGVEVGEGGIRAECFDFRLHALRVVENQLRPQDHEPGIAAETIAQLVAELSDEDPRLIGVGVAVPGASERGDDGARVQAPSIGWHDVPLERLSAGAPGRSRVGGERRQGTRAGRDVVRCRPWRSQRRRHTVGNRRRRCDLRRRCAVSRCRFECR